MAQFGLTAPIVSFGLRTGRVKAGFTLAMRRGGFGKGWTLMVTSGTRLVTSHAVRGREGRVRRSVKVISCSIWAMWHGMCLNHPRHQKVAAGLTSVRSPCDEVECAERGLILRSRPPGARVGSGDDDAMMDAKALPV